MHFTFPVGPGFLHYFSLEVLPVRVLNIQEILSDLRSGSALPSISARFHNTLAELTLQIALKLRSQVDQPRVALSGGVWQNISLLRSSCDKLDKNGFKTLINKQVPANDGGIALGQAVLGQKYLMNN